MGNLTIGKKLYASFGALIALLLCISVLAITQMSGVAGEYEKVIKEYVEMDETAMMVQTSLLKARRYEKDFISHKDEKDIKKWEEAMAEIDKDVATIKTLAAQTGMKATEAEAIIHGATIYREGFEDVIHQVHLQGDKETGIRGDMRKYAHKMETVMKETGYAELLVPYLTLRRHEKDFILREDHKYIAKANKEVDNIKTVLTELYVDDQLASQIMQHAQNYVKSFGEFGESIAIEHEDFAKMSEAAHEIEEAAHTLEERVAAVVTSQTDHAHHRAETTDIWLAALCFAAVLLGMGASFWSVRSITKPLGRAIETIGNGSDQVSSASEQIAESSGTLAEGTSEQAASLEETSASLEEISAMTTQNAGNANEVNSMMAETSEFVERSGTSMAQLTTSMQEIAKASEETQKIIKTIDDIAFQTNLLSLNAAVEAARAGEAGAGFAVVADEVRNLAMRASEAAKNTSGLIENSVTQIQQGSQLAEKCNEDFTMVAENAEKVALLVEEISTAAKEQSTGIEQISTAVNEMDKVTQGNAANAEESSAAAEELDTLSDQLQETVAELQQMIGGRKLSVAQPTVKKAAAPVVPKTKRITAGERMRSVEEIIPLDDGDMDDFKDFGTATA